MTVMCHPCDLIGQWALNWLNLIDHAGNTLLLGNPNETMSARTARARVAGRSWATWACRALTWGQIAVTFGRVTRDHCAYALDASVLPNSRELLDLTSHPPRIRPRNIVDDEEITT